MTKSRPHYRFQVILTAAIYNRLARESKDSGVPMGALIRRYLDASLPAARQSRSATTPTEQVPK